MLLGVFLFAGIIVPVLGAIESKETILSFEQESPVYTTTTIQGTELKDLELPETLRATVVTQDVVENSRGGVHIVPLMTPERWWRCL